MGHRKHHGGYRVLPNVLDAVCDQAGHLWATWSRRNGRRAIYGPNPAICYTEMPTAAFIETSRSRERLGQKISTFALTFLKDQMFNLGANPVIYGFSDRSAILPTGDDGGPRIIDQAILPLREQYRYVTYSPTGPIAIDWTHEREWRWPYTDDISTYERKSEGYGIVEGVTDIPGLDLYSGELSEMGVIVNSREESKMVLHDILSLYDRHVIGTNTYSYILATDEFGTIANLRDPKQERAAIDAATIDLRPFITPDPARDKAITRRIREMIREIEGESSGSEVGEFGGCWLWIVDNFHDVTRALLNEGRVSINNHGQYLVNLYEYDDSRSLRQRENMTIELAKRVSSAFGVSAGYFSVLGSDDYNTFPSYNDDHSDSNIHYNWYHYGL